MGRNRMQLLTFGVLCLLPMGIAWADGAVYAMTNALGNNAIQVYHRASDGNLNPTPVQTIATGGGGSGLQLSAVDSLGSAGSVQLDQTHHLLFAVNTESANENDGVGTYNEDCRQGTITSFRVASDGTLTFADRVASGGLFPNSITVRRNQGQNGNAQGQDGQGAGTFDLIYVLNAGGPGTCGTSPNIAGFTVELNGRMHPVGSKQAIDPFGPVGPTTSCPPVGFTPSEDFVCGLNPPSFVRSPAQVRFTPVGNQLVVTVKGTSTIYVFPVNANGSAGKPTTTQAPGPALPSYFGFTFDKNKNLMVTELFGASTVIPTGGAGALSSFAIDKAGDLTANGAQHVGDLGTAACWIALEPVTGGFVFVSNNLSASISSYTVAADGSLTLLTATAATGSGPNDLATATEGGTGFLYVVDAGSGTVGAFQINQTNGALTALTGGSGLPTTHSQGIAAF